MMQRSVRRLSFVIALLAFLMVIGTGISPAQSPAAVHGVRVSTRTFVDPHGIVRHHTVVTIANMAPPDGAHDVSYLVTDRGVTRTMYAAGTLSVELPALATPTTSNLSQVNVACVTINRSDAYDYGCLHVYKYVNAPSDPNHWYRVFYWVASGHPQSGYDATGSFDSWNVTTSHSFIDDWAPTATKYPPGSGSSTQVSLGLSVGGVSASASTTITEYSYSYGPASITSTAFSFGWFSGLSESGSDRWIGVSGGHELAVDAGYTYSYNKSIIFDTCDEPC